MQHCSNIAPILLDKHTGDRGKKACSQHCCNFTLVYTARNFLLSLAQLKKLLQH